MSRSRWKLVAVVALGLLCFILGFQNTRSAEIHLLFFSFSLPLVLLIGICLLLGMLIGWILTSRGRGKAARDLKSVQPAQPEPAGMTETEKTEREEA